MCLHSLKGRAHARATSRVDISSMFSLSILHQSENVSPVSRPCWLSILLRDAAKVWRPASQRVAYRVGGHTFGLCLITKWPVAAPWPAGKAGWVSDLCADGDVEPNPGPGEGLTWIPWVVAGVMATQHLSAAVFARGRESMLQGVYWWLIQNEPALDNDRLRPYFWILYRAVLIIGQGDGWRGHGPPQSDFGCNCPQDFRKMELHQVFCGDLVSLFADAAGSPEGLGRRRLDEEQCPVCGSDNVALCKCVGSVCRWCSDPAYPCVRPPCACILEEFNQTAWAPIPELDSIRAELEGFFLIPALPPVAFCWWVDPPPLFQESDLMGWVKSVILDGDVESNPGPQDDQGVPAQQLLMILRILAQAQEELEVVQTRLRNRETHPLGLESPRCHRWVVGQCVSLVGGIIGLMDLPFLGWQPHWKHFCRWQISRLVSSLEPILDLAGVSRGPGGPRWAMSRRHVYLGDRPELPQSAWDVVSDDSDQEEDDDSVALHEGNFACRFCTIRFSTLEFLSDHLAWCAEFLWKALLTSLPFDAGFEVRSRRYCRLCPRPMPCGCARGLFEWAYAAGALPPTLSRCWGQDHLPVILIGGDENDWVPDLTAHGDVERNPGPCASVWIRQLTMDGDVEANPGPPKSQSALLHTCTEADLVECLMGSPDTAMHIDSPCPVQSSGPHARFEFAADLREISIAAPRENHPAGKARPTSKRQPVRQTSSSSSSTSSSSSAVVARIPEPDWDFETYEDIAHPPKASGGRLESATLSDGPLPKRPEIGAGPRGRASELSHALQRSAPSARGQEGPPLHQDAATYVRTPPPVPLREVLALNLSTVRHVPGSVRPRVQLAVAQALRGLVDGMDAISLWRLQAFPKLVLRGTGDPKAHPGLDAGHIIAARLDQWEAGSFCDLWLQAKAENDKGKKQPPKPKGTAPKLKPTDEKLVGAMRALVAEGAPRKALNLLTSDGLHDLTDPTVLPRLQALHPAGSPVDLSALPAVPDPGLPSLEDIKFWSDAVIKGVADFPRGSAPGPSGLRPSCLYDLLKRGPHVSKLVTELAAFVALAAHGMLPADLAPLFGAASLIPLRKPDGGVRPIAIGETLRRLVGKALMHLPKLMGELKALAPLQCGVGIVNACESIGQGLQALVDTLPAQGDWVALQVDVINAFNTIDRTEVLRGTATLAPTMFPWLRTLYGQPAMLFCQGSVLLSRTGVHQGCPLGPAAFAVGIHKAAQTLEAWALQWGVFYLDDGLLVGPVERVQQAFSTLRDSLAAIGLAVNLHKCAVWGPGSDLVGALPEEHPLRAVPVTPFSNGSGVKMVGVPVGKLGETTFQDACLAKRVVQLESACGKLGALPDPQLQHCLLRQCLDACKLQFSLRTTTTVSSTASGLLQRADETILGVMEEAVGGGLGVAARQQVGLPFAMGGCGVRLPTCVRGPARLAGMAAYLQTGKRLVGVPEVAMGTAPEDAHEVIRQARTTLGDTFDPLTTWARDPGNIALADREYAKQSWWGEKFDQARRRNLQAGVAGRDAARLESQSGGYGATWMQVVPAEGSRTIISAEDYRLGLRWVLGLPLLGQDKEGAECPACGQQVDIYGDHLLCCRRNNYYGRHYAVQESFVSMAQAGDQPFLREAPLLKQALVPQGRPLRPADLLLRAWQGGKDLAVDVTISHPLQAAQQPWSAEKARGYLAMVEKRKLAKYKEACALEGWDFVGAAFDTWGGVGPGAKQILFKLLKRAVGGVPVELRALHSQEHKQQLSLSLMRQVWKLLAAKYALA